MKLAVVIEGAGRGMSDEGSSRHAGRFFGKE